MSKVLFHGSIKGFSGRIGNLIFRQMPDGTTVVSQAPQKKTGRQKERAKEKRSPRQKAHNERFAYASAYASTASKENPVYARLAAADPMRNARNFAMADWFHAPEIHRIQKRGKHIRVEATDNVKVAEVKVTILNKDGKVLEEGECTKGRGNWWTFTPTVTGHTILAEARDLPGNVTRLVLQ
jgi:hypothetical protein